MFIAFGRVASIAVLLATANEVRAQLPEKKLQSTTADNLKQQMVALQKYHDQNDCFPPAFRTSEEGKPLLSWRVAILPFLGEHKLYADFHLDEPWDSEHNKSLVAKMPEVFRAPASKADAGKTTYMGNGGPVGVIARPSVRLEQVIDGTANTLAIVEVGDKAAVVWTKPAEWVFKAPESIDDFAGLPGEEFSAALCFGNILHLPKATPPVQLTRMFNREDGEFIEWPPRVAGRKR